MPRVELAKSIEARKLNRWTGRPVDTLWLTVPFGAILENIVEKGDLVEFAYLGELYHCKQSDVKDLLRAAEVPVGEVSTELPGNAPGGNWSKPVETILRWEKLRSDYGDVRRAKVPGGWLISMDSGSLVFYPDPGHCWDGGGADRQPAPGRELPG